MSDFPQATEERDINILARLDELATSQGGLSTSALVAELRFFRKSAEKLLTQPFPRVLTNLAKEQADQHDFDVAIYLIMLRALVRRKPELDEVKEYDTGIINIIIQKYNERKLKV